MDNSRVSVKVGRSYLQRLRLIARAEGRTIRWLIEQAISALLKERKQ